LAENRIKKKIQFYYQAQGSLTELKNHLYIAKDVGYIDVKTFEEIFAQTITVHKLLQGLITKSKSILES
jgi:four helix bundle protein